MKSKTHFITQTQAEKIASGPCPRCGNELCFHDRDGSLTEEWEKVDCDSCGFGGLCVWGRTAFYQNNEAGTDTKSFPLEYVERNAKIELIIAQFLDRSFGCIGWRHDQLTLGEKSIVLTEASLQAIKTWTETRLAAAKENEMKLYTVVYQNGDTKLWETFECHADHSNHAEEQCDAAYPDCDVIWTTEGDTEEAFTEMRRALKQ